MLKVRAALTLMEFSDGHPRLVRFLLRPIANLPWLRGKLKVMIRAYMGATAFDIHEVDVEKGRIGIGGVDEIMFGSELVWVLHEVLGRHGEEEKIRALYDQRRPHRHGKAGPVDGKVPEQGARNGIAHHHKRGRVGKNRGVRLRLHADKGGAAGHVSAITGERYTGVEVECSASGAARCVFEFAPAARSEGERERSALADRLLALDRDGCAGRQ